MWVRWLLAAPMNVSGFPPDSPVRELLARPRAGRRMRVIVHALVPPSLPGAEACCSARRPGGNGHRSAPRPGTDAGWGKPGRGADAGSGEPGRSADAHDRHRCQARTVGSAPRVRDRPHPPLGQGELMLGIGADARWGELSLHTRGSLRERAAAARQDSDGPCYGASTHGQGRRQSELRRAASPAAARGTSEIRTPDPSRSRLLAI